MNNKKIYYALIATFSLLYIAVAIVSTLHAVTFFKLANSTFLAILLGAGFEIGQATVLFSILLTDHKERKLSWAMMFLLTSLQVTANVFASYKYMIATGTNDWELWRQVILVGVQAENPQMYQVIISWIIGALLPIIALGMTALVADNIHLLKDKPKNIEDKLEKESGLVTEIEEEAFEEASLTDLQDIEDKIEKPININDDVKKVLEESSEKTMNKIRETNIKPVNKERGWHLRKRYIDNVGNIFEKGKYIGREISPKKSTKKKEKKTEIPSTKVEVKKVNKVTTEIAENDEIKKTNTKENIVDNVNVVDIKK